MNLKDVIARLEQEDPDRLVERGWDGWDSWRGRYSELAFSPASATVAEMLAVCQDALEAGTMTGYKGGEYPVHEYTECNVAYEGTYGGRDDTLTSDGLEYRLTQ